MASAPIFFYKSRKHRHRADKCRDLAGDSRQVRAKLAHDTFDKTGFCDRGAHDQGARYDDHDVVAKSFEGFGRWDDTDRHRREQRKTCDDIVAPPSPGEENHHGDDNGKCQGLVEGHGREECAGESADNRLDAFPVPERPSRRPTL